MNNTHEVKPPSKAGLTSKLEHLVSELEHHKELVKILEQECVKLYAQLKVLDKEDNNELR